MRGGAIGLRLCCRFKVPSERMMVNSEREMVRRNEESPVKEERFTSLQPTYEDSVPPEDDWEFERDSS